MAAAVFKLRSVLLAYGVALLVLACGGEGAVGEGGTGVETPSVSIGVVDAVSPDSVMMTKDTRPYDVKSAEVVDGFGAPLAPSALKRGMWVQIDGLASTAAVGVETVRLEPAVRGVVTSVFPLTVLGSEITAYTSTVRDGPNATSPYQIGQTIEVHGRLGRPGEVEASRIERLAATDARQPELRGLVRSVDESAKTLVLENQLIDYGDLSPDLLPQVGDSMRVSAVEPPSGSTAWRINSLRLTRQSSTSGVPSYYQQGFTKDFVAQAGAGATFTIEGVAIDASAAIVDAEVNGNDVCVIVLGERRADGTVRATAVFWNNLGSPTY